MPLPPFIRFEDAVTTAIETRAEACRSDAQAIVEAKPALLRECFDAGMSADDTAARILGEEPAAAAADDTDELVETIRWVPVAKRVPDSERTVLVRAVSKGVVSIGTGFLSMYSVSRTWRDATAFPWDDGEVTHWAEQPKGPAC